MNMTPQYIKINKDRDKRYFSDKEMTIYHREDGPAIETVSGHKFWILNGKFHRKGGPAVEYVDGTNEWWLDDIKYTKKQFKKEIANLLEKQDKI